jgi:dCTP deaminase
MILCDREIKAAIARGALRITPMPHDKAWSSTAVDLTLAPELVVLKTPYVAGVRTPVSPADPNYQFEELIRGYGAATSIGESGHIFKAGEFLLGWTCEKIRMPHRSRLAARVEGKSSLARLGIGVHVTAPTIHAGFGDKKVKRRLPRLAIATRDVELRPSRCHARGGNADLPIDL